MLEISALLFFLNVDFSKFTTLLKPIDHCHFKLGFIFFGRSKLDIQIKRIHKIQIMNLKTVFVHKFTKISFT